MPVSEDAYTRPIVLPRPGWRRRIEAFSPKLGRRLSFTAYDAWRTWLAIEANPAIPTFCERPAFVEGRSGPVIDFWVQPRGLPRGEFWLIEPDRASDSAQASNLPDRLHDLPVRRILRADLASWSVPVANWAHIVPYLVSYRRFRDPLLEQSLVVFLGRSSSLDTVLERFAEHDASRVQAALYQLLAEGRVVSPNLAAAALSGHTRFRRP